ncbi:hypothetical protein MGN70_002447 [Eutypa lata]|nr:hypothetical protein MGN70_002447 [Eutypa lata]
MACCPPGSWTCATSSPGWDSNNSGRRCMSLLTGQTEIWLTWDPPFTAQDLQEWYTWPTWVASEAVQDAATVWHDVFPLQLATSGLGVAVQPTASGNKSVTAINVAASSPNYVSEAVPISTMTSTTTIVAVATVVVLGPLAALLIFLMRMRRKKKTSVLNTVTAIRPTHSSDEVSLSPKLQLESA